MHVFVLIFTFIICISRRNSFSSVALKFEHLGTFLSLLLTERKWQGFKRSTPPQAFLPPPCPLISIIARYLFLSLFLVRIVARSVPSLTFQQHALFSPFFSTKHRTCDLHITIKCLFPFNCGALYRLWGPVAHYKLLGECNSFSLI